MSEKIPGYVNSYERLQEVMEARGLTEVKLDIGSGGFSSDETFISVDLYTDADIQAPMWSIPLPDDSVDVIWSDHALEHVPKEGVVPTLCEWGRLVKPGGNIQFFVPDLEWCLLWWLRHQTTGWDMDVLYGNQNHPGEFHRTGYSMDIILDYIRKLNWEMLLLEKDPPYTFQVNKLQYMGGEEYDVTLTEKNEVRKTANGRSIAVDLVKIPYEIRHITTGWEDADIR